jgi:methionine--tRNA ligase beta chain
MCKKVLVKNFDGVFVEGTLEKDSNFWGGWKVVYGNSSASIKIAKIKEMKDKITFEEFLEIEGKLEIRIGEIVSADRVPKSDKLLVMYVNFGPKIGDKVCVTNLGQYDEPSEFVGSICPFVMNLKPSKMMGIESEVMIMVGEDDDDGISGYHINQYPLGAKIL